MLSRADVGALLSGSGACAPLVGSGERGLLAHAKSSAVAANPRVCRIGRPLKRVPGGRTDPRASRGSRISRGGSDRRRSRDEVGRLAAVRILGGNHRSLVYPDFGTASGAVAVCARCDSGGAELRSVRLPGTGNLSHRFRVAGGAELFEFERERRLFFGSQRSQFG